MKLQRSSKDRRFHCQQLKLLLQIPCHKGPGSKARVDQNSPQLGITGGKGGEGKEGQWVRI